MECPKCKTKNDDNDKLCKMCGYNFTDKNVNTSTPENPTSIPNDGQGKGKKNYATIFWSWFAGLVALNIVSVIISFLEEEGYTTTTFSDYASMAFAVVFIVVLVLFIQTTHRALKEVGKNWGWVLGFLILIPYGFWIPFLVVRSLLKPAGMWRSKKQSSKLPKKV